MFLMPMWLFRHLQCKPNQESLSIQFYVICIGKQGLKSIFRGEIYYTGMNILQRKTSIYLNCELKYLLFLNRDKN